MIATAANLLVLSPVVSHGCFIDLATPTNVRIYLSVHDEINLTLSDLLQDSLTTLLDMLQGILSQERLPDWPAISLALCLLRSEVESMQMDIQLLSERPDRIYKTMDETAV